MVLAVTCAILAVVFLLGQRKTDTENRNGGSVYFLQKCLSFIQVWFIKHPFIALILLAKPRTTPSMKIAVKQASIERLVWIRLLVVSVIALIIELLMPFCCTSYIKSMCAVAGIYILLLQFTLLTSLLRPLFGVEIDPITGSMNQQEARKRTPYILAPRRSLLMALVNFFEILLAWAVIYRCLMPTVVKTLDQANYFSIVTLTTLGYGDVNAGDLALAQLAITANMIIFLVFSICHITTIMGAMSTDHDFRNDSSAERDV